jgi:hypothetical protein
MTPKGTKFKYHRRRAMKRLTTVAALVLATTSSFVWAQSATTGHYASPGAGVYETD